MIKFILTSIITFFIVSCNTVSVSKIPTDKTSPVNTMKILKNAIKNKNWKEAKSCFSREIQNQNKDNILKEKFYCAPYWTTTQTVQILFGPLYIVTQDAEFVETFSKPDHAVVYFGYGRYVSKDMRMRDITLKKNKSGEWKIAEVYGRTNSVNKQ